MEGIFIIIMEVKQQQFILNVSKIAIILLIALFVCKVYTDADKDFKISVIEAAQAVLAEGAEGRESQAEEPSETDLQVETGEDTVNNEAAQEETSDTGRLAEVRAPKGSVMGVGADFRQIFKLNPENYDGLIYFRPASNMDVTELLIAKTDSPDKKTELLNSINKRLEAQKASFEGYAPEQFGLLDSAVVSDKGNFVFFMVSDDADKYYSSFVRVLKR